VRLRCPEPLAPLVDLILPSSTASPRPASQHRQVIANPGAACQGAVARRPAPGDRARRRRLGGAILFTWRSADARGCLGRRRRSATALRRVSRSRVPFAGGDQLDGGLSAVREAEVDAIVVFPEGATMVARAKIAQPRSPDRCPRCSAGASTADAGGLMRRSEPARSLRPPRRLRRQAFRGAKAPELPIEQPSQLELVVNTRRRRRVESASRRPRSCSRVAGSNEDEG
jgi:hypothetical protein